MVRFLSSIRSRVLLLVLLALVPAFGLNVQVSTQLRRLAASQTRESALQSVKAAASNYQQLIEGVHQFLIVLAQLPAVHDSNADTCSAFLLSLLRQYPHYDSLIVVWPNGHVHCSTDLVSDPTDFSRQYVFQHVLLARDFSISEYRTARFSGKGVLTFAYPLLDKIGQVEAVLLATLDVNSLEQRSLQPVMVPGSTIMAIDRTGTIVARYPDSDKWVGRQETEAPIIRIILGERREGTAEAIGEDNVLRLYAFTPLPGVPENDVFVVFGVPTATAYAEVNQVLDRTLIALGLVTVVALSAAWVGVDVFLMRWVRALLTTTSRLADGNLSARTGLHYGVGELSQLARAFDKMVETLEQRETERKQADEQLRRQIARAESLVRIAGHLNAQLDRQDVLNAVCREAARALNAPATSVSLYSQDRDTLYFAAGYGLPSDYGEKVRSISRNELDQHTGALGSVFAFTDIQAFSGTPNADLFAALDIRTIARARMVREDCLLGTLDVFVFGRERRFTSDELILLEGLAAQAAQALANASLYEALQREERARGELLHEIITTQERERMRIARELHDETSQSLSALMVGLATARVALVEKAENVEDHLNDVRCIAEGMLDNMHRLISDLRPSLLDDLGLVPAITWYGESRLNPLGIVFSVDQDSLRDRLSPSLETALFRIVQEAVTNVVRHAQASRVKVRLGFEAGIVTLRVEDNGQGFVSALLESDSDHKHFGLRGMQERVGILKGEFRLETAPGQGTVITVRVPWSREDEDDGQDSRPLG
jgi:signal transduction histidine kinase